MKHLTLILFALSVFSLQLNAQTKAKIVDKSGLVAYTWEGKTCADFNAWLGTQPSAVSSYWSNNYTCKEDRVVIVAPPCIIDFIIKRNLVGNDAALYQIVLDMARLSQKELLAKYCLVRESLPDTPTKN